MDTYAEGKLVRLIGTFTNNAGAVQDPAVVKVVVKTPEGVSTTYTYGTDVTLIKDSTGIYHFDVDTTGKPGVWHYRWYSTGSGQSATTDSYFEVRQAYPT